MHGHLNVKQINHHCLNYDAFTNLLFPKLVLIFKEKPMRFKKETERQRVSTAS
jgi:hypothetical protein